MENNELQNIWKNIDSEINLKSKDELNLLLIAKTKKTINKFLYVISISIFVCIGLIVFLIITALDRKTDIYYQINNLTLCLVAVIALVSSLQGWYKMQNNRYNQPLKSWLEERINSLSKELTGRFSKLYLFLIPILYVLTTLSIRVYFENKPFIEVLKTEESVIGLIVSAPIGLFVSYFSAKKIRKYYLKNLEYLKKLHDLLCTS
ncbi:MAG TPA: hypothetical protein VIH57_02695 [Bacteroidales bacterium]